MVPAPPHTQSPAGRQCVCPPTQAGPADTWEPPPGTPFLISASAPFRAPPQHPHPRLCGPASTQGAQGGPFLWWSPALLDTPLCTQFPVHNPDRPTRLPSVSPAPGVLCVPSAQEEWCPAGISSRLAPLLSGWTGSDQSPLPGPPGVPVAWPFCSKVSLTARES